MVNRGLIEVITTIIQIKPLKKLNSKSQLFQKLNAKLKLKLSVKSKKKSKKSVRVRFRVLA